MSAIRVELQLADGSFTTGMLRAGQSLEQFNKQLMRTNPNMAEVGKGSGLIYSSMRRAEQSTKSFLGTLRDASIVISAFSFGATTAARVASGWAGDIVKVNSEIERLKLLMASMSSSKDPFLEAAENVDLLLNKAKQAPFTLSTFTNAFVKLKATGTDPLGGSLEALSDGIAAFGGTDEAFNRIVLGISQMRGKGVIQMEEMRQQLSEAMPRAMELMARSMGLSMADLVDAIGTGRVEAEYALEQLYREIDNTFGGAALRMMNTWEGKMSQMATNFQQLSLIAGEGFFEEIKQYLNDINAFLDSPAGEEFARTLGQQMGQVATYTRTVIDNVVKYRDTIVNAAKIIGAAFAGKLLFSGLDQSARALANLSTGITRVLGDVAAWRNASTAAVAARQSETTAVNLHTTAVKANTVAQAENAVASRANATAVVASIGGAASRVSMFAGALAGSLGWIGLVGAGLFTLADHFGWFKDRAREAADAMGDFNAQTREELDEATELAMQRAEKLKTQADNLFEFLTTPRYIEGYINRWYTSAQQDEIEAYIAQRADDLAVMRDEYDQIIADIAGAENRFLAKVIRDGTNELKEAQDAEIQAIQSEWDRTRVAYTRLYDERAANAASSGEDPEELRLERLQIFHAEEIRLLDMYLENYQNHYDEAVQMAAESSGDEQAIWQAHADAQAAHINRIYEQRETLRDAGPRGIKLLEGLGDGEVSVFERATKALEKMTKSLVLFGYEGDEVAMMLAEIDDAIERQDFGNVENGEEAYRALREELALTAKAEKDLDDARKARMSLNDRLANLAKEQELKLWKARREAAGQTTTELDELQWAIERGDYIGFGPDDLMSAELRETISQLDGMDAAARRVARTSQDQAFGTQTRSDIQSTADQVRDVREEVLQLAAALGGIDFSALRFDASGGSDLLLGYAGGYSGVPSVSSGDKRARMAQAMQYFMSQGWTEAQASGIVGNLAGESAFNPNARNVGDGRDGSDSIGIAQWNSSRATALHNFARARDSVWNDFQTQLEFIQHELETTEATAGNRLRLAGTPEQASDTFMRAFERPSDKSMLTSGPIRAAAALEAVGLVGSDALIVQIDAPSIAAITDTFVAPVSSIADQLRDNPVRTHAQAIQTVDGLREQDEGTRQLEQQNSLNAAIRQLESAIENVNAGVAHDGFSLEQAQRRILAGDLGSTDLSSAEFQPLLTLASEYEGIIERIKETEDARREGQKSLVQLAEQEAELTAQAADLHEQLRTGVEGSASKLRDFLSDVEDHVRQIEMGYGTESAEYQTALEHRAQLLSQFHATQNLEERISSEERTRAIQQSLMGESNARRYAMERQIAILDAQIAAVDQSEAQGVELVRQYEAEKAAIRAQYAQQASPLMQQMQEWGDFQGNLAKQSTQWMNSLADGLTNLITGTGDLRSTLQGIIKDFLNTSIKFMLSGGGSKGGGAKGGIAKTAMAGGGGKGGLGKIFGMAHTGGIIGQSRLATAAVNPSVFAGAKKYHTGGIIPGGRRLTPGEVPIIAKEGEGIFTPEQMRHLGGTSIASSVNISAPVTVNATGGTPEQNADLAKTISRQLQNELRGLVMQEMMQATRPGNFANSRSR